MKKQTSIEWFANEIMLANEIMNADPCNFEMAKLLDQAKEMHEEELIKAFVNGCKWIRILTNAQAQTNNTTKKHLHHEPR